MSLGNPFVSGPKIRGQGHESQKHCRRWCLHYCECWLLLTWTLPLTRARSLCDFLNVLPARRYANAGISRRRVSVCVCVCLSVSVTRQYCIKTAKRRITQTTPRDSTGTLVFWRQQSLVDDPFPWNLRSKWPIPLPKTTISTNIRS